MNKIVILSLVLALSAFAKSSSHSTTVSGYTKKNGTHVDSYHRTSKDSTQKNNTKPN